MVRQSNLSFKRQPMRMEFAGLRIVASFTNAPGAKHGYASMNLTSPLSLMRICKAHKLLGQN